MTVTHISIISFRIHFVIIWFLLFSLVQNPCSSNIIFGTDNTSKISVGIKHKLCKDHHTAEVMSSLICYDTEKPGMYEN